MKIVIDINENKEQVSSSPVDDARSSHRQARADKLTEFELSSLQGQVEVIKLLSQVIEQLKVMNHFVTPAKSIGKSGVEKHMAQYQVAERIVHHLQRELLNNS